MSDFIPNMSVPDEKIIPLSHQNSINNVCSGYANRGFSNFIDISMVVHRLPLMLASRKSRKGIVKLLLANGANVNVKHSCGKTALMLASKPGGKYDAVYGRIILGGTKFNQNSAADGIELTVGGDVCFSLRVQYGVVKRSWEGAVFIV